MGILTGKQNLSEEERKNISQELKDGYKKMAALNKKLAEDGFIANDEAKE